MTAIISITPRTCGEHLGTVGSNKTGIQSPPHMRGTPLAPLLKILLTRITPVHAGNTSILTHTYVHFKDHPSTCGEHENPLKGMITFLGSPPHIRGTRDHRHRYIRLYRITPAHAGNTLIAATDYRLLKDHPRTRGEHMSNGHYFHIFVGSPRTRGEHTIWFRSSRTFEGSPPHMRGTLLCQHLAAGSWMITPAHAGNTLGSACQ